MDRVSIRELEYFVAVAEELSFSRAAARLHLSQPPLSRQIKGLEEKLGVVLLNRETQPVTLTQPGTLFLADARQILRHLDQAAEMVRRAGAGEVERFEVGFVGSTLEDRMTKTLYRFRQAHPHVQLVLREMDAPELLRELQEKTLDGAFVGTSPVHLPKGFRMVLWSMAPVWIALSKTHPLAQREALHLRELSNEAWICQSREVAPAYYRQFLLWCSEEGFRPRITAETGRVAAVLAMVAIGDGISLVPESTMRTCVALPELIFKKLESPFAVLVQVFACRENDPSPALGEFVRMLEEDAEI